MHARQHRGERDWRRRRGLFARGASPQGQRLGPIDSSVRPNSEPVAETVTDVAAELPIALEAPDDNPGRHLELPGEGLDFGQRYDPSQLGVVTSRDEEVSGKRIRLQLLAAVDVSVIDEGQALSVE